MVLKKQCKSYPVVVNIFDVLFNNSKSVTSSSLQRTATYIRRAFEIAGTDDKCDVGNGKTSSNIKGKRTSKKRGRGEKLVTVEGATASLPLERRATNITTERVGSKMQQEKLLARKDDLRLVPKEVKDSIRHGSNDTGANRIQLIPQIMSSNKKEIQKFMDSAINAGCEGIMLKHLKSVYRAGSREYLWMKVKREYRSELADTLDLVIVGALYGRGRRVGKYGALLLGAYDEKEDLFRSVSKVGTGFTDQHLESFYNSLESLRIGHKSPRVDTRMEQMDVWFEPKIVIEVIASEITLSPAHTAGLKFD